MLYFCLKYRSNMPILPTDTLFLTIKKVWLDKIIAGSKIIEYRDFTEYYISRLCICNKETGDIEDTKPYRYVLFQAGYSKKSPRAKFELKGIFLTEYINEIPEFYNKGDMAFELEIGKQVKI